MKCRIYKFILTAVLIGAALSCSGKNQQTEANIRVGEANKLIAETNTLIEQTESRNQTLFDADVKTDAELAAYKIKMKSEAQAIIENYAQAAARLKAIADKFEEASRMNVQEIYKNYAGTKSAEFAKRAEAFELRKGNAQAFIEIEAPKEMTDKFDENNSRFEKLLREADELSETAQNIEIENRDFFAELKSS